MSAVAPTSELTTERRAFLSLALAVLLFASAWPVMKAALNEATPIWFAAGRSVVGALGVGALFVVRGKLRLPPRGDWPIVFSIGLLQMAGFFLFGNLGLQYLPAGRSIILAYTTSLWLVPLALLSGEPIGGRHAIGIILGLAGIATLINPVSLDWSDRNIVMGHLFLLIAALTWALSIFHARHHRWVSAPSVLLPWQLLVCAISLVLCAAIFEPAGRLPATPAIVATVLYLGFLVTPVGSFCATLVSAALPTLVTSLGFLAVPIIGFAVATLWLAEPVTPSLAIGGALTLLGLILVTTARRA
jgi:drug/metabolite transporter (DMT)-like permease